MSSAQNLTDCPKMHVAAATSVHFSVYFFYMRKTWSKITYRWQSFIIFFVSVAIVAIQEGGGERYKLIVYFNNSSFWIATLKKLKSLPRVLIE